MSDDPAAFGGRLSGLLDFLDRAGCPLAQPLVVEALPGGRSNLSLRLETIDGRRVVVRRPPFGPLLPSAHDVVREAGILRRLETTDVPVPEILATCDDTTVIGVPFFVMEYVDGAVLRSTSDMSGVPEAARADCSRSLVDVLARIHQVDLAATGLDGLARRDGYLPRQLARWTKQWELGSTREIPSVSDVAAHLDTMMPPDRDSVLVHGDYRFDNVLMSSNHEVCGVLDWELSTLGDPLADLGILLAYWTERDSEIGPLDAPPTIAPGLPSRAAVTEMYSIASGRDVDGLSWYVAFALWKLAIIMEGVRTRHASSAFGESELDLDDLARRADALVGHAQRMLFEGSE